MSKFGWDLPPGCRLSDIPGNRPEDQRMEALYDTLADILVGNGFFIDSPEGDKALEALAKVVEKAYGDGYAEGGSDERMAQAYKEEKDDGHS